MSAIREQLEVPAEAWSIRHLFVRGHVIQDKYRVEEILGVGGIGVVLSVTHLQLDERVALKILLPGAAGDPDLVARFEREARAVIKIRSEHVVRVYDVGKLDDRTPYFVMEQLDGNDLGHHLARDGAFPIPTTVDYVLQACEALAEAHSLGMVHRDLKPSNLFLVHRRDGSPCIKLIDFGMTKVATTDRAALTHSRAIMGSPSYISPEQLTSSRDVDVRSDIWSLGVVLYEMLTGALPFNAETVPGLMIQIVQGPPTALRECRDEVPEELERVVMKCLAKSPADRYENVAALASALSPFGSLDAATSSARILAVLASVDARSSSSDPLLGAGAKSSPRLPDRTPRGTVTPAGSQVRPSAVRSRRRAIALGALAATLALGGLSLWLRSQAPVPQPLPRATGAPPLSRADADLPIDRASPVTSTTATTAESANADAAAAAAGGTASGATTATASAVPPTASATPTTKHSGPAAPRDAPTDEFSGFGQRK